MYAVGLSTLPHNDLLPLPLLNSCIKIAHIYSTAARLFKTSASCLLSAIVGSLPQLCFYLTHHFSFDNIYIF